MGGGGTVGLLTGFYARSVKKAELYLKRHRPFWATPPSTGGRAGTGRASVTDPEAQGTATAANDTWEEQVPAAGGQGEPQCCGCAGVGAEVAPGPEPPGHSHNLWHLVAQAAEQQRHELGEEGVAVPQVQQPAAHHARHRPPDLRAKGAQWVCVGRRWRPWGRVTQERSGPGPAPGAQLGRPRLGCRVSGPRRPTGSGLWPPAPASLRHEAAWRVCDVPCRDPRPGWAVAASRGGQRGARGGLPDKVTRTALQTASATGKERAPNTTRRTSSPGAEPETGPCTMDGVTGAGGGGRSRAEVWPGLSPTPPDPSGAPERDGPTGLSHQGRGQWPCA